MGSRMSNRDRIAKAAAEAEATRKEKAEAKARPKKKATAKKKAAAKKKPVAKKKPAVKKTSRAKKKGRVKLVWVVCDPSGAPIRQYPYREKKDAEAEVKRLTSTKGKTHMLKTDRVPMAADE